MRKLRPRTVLTTLLVAMTSCLALSPPPASTAEACRSGWLCLYKNTGFTNLAFTTQRRGVCWNLDAYGITSVGSYRNNLPVYVNFFDASQDDLVWRIRPGGSSSNATSFPDERFVCTDS